MRRRPAPVANEAADSPTSAAPRVLDEAAAALLHGCASAHSPDQPAAPAAQPVQRRRGRCVCRLVPSLSSTDLRRPRWPRGLRCRYVGVATLKRQGVLQVGQLWCVRAPRLRHIPGLRVGFTKLEDVYTTRVLRAWQVAHMRCVSFSTSACRPTCTSAWPHACHCERDTTKHLLRKRVISHFRLAPRVSRCGDGVDDHPWHHSARRTLLARRRWWRVAVAAAVSAMAAMVRLRPSACRRARYMYDGVKVVAPPPTPQQLLLPSSRWRRRGGCAPERWLLKLQDADVDGVDRRAQGR